MKKLDRLEQEWRGRVKASENELAGFTKTLEYMQSLTPPDDVNISLFIREASMLKDSADCVMRNVKRWRRVEYDWTQGEDSKLRALREEIRITSENDGYCGYSMIKYETMFSRPKWYIMDRIKHINSMGE